MSSKKVKAPTGVPKKPKSLILKRSIVIDGHKTSMSLEDPFWKWLKAIAGRHDQTLSTAVAMIKANNKNTNLSSAIRLYVLNYAAGPAPTQEAA